MTRSVLFLDIDGVVNRCGKSAQGLETDKVELLRQIVEATGCAIVLSSTWRKTEHQRERIIRMCQSIGATLLGCTPVLERQIGSLYVAQARGKEIQHWLDRNPTERFVILDDDADMGHLLPHLIKTESFTGLTPEIAQRVIDALGQPPHS